jgi:hypothetical protein
MNWHVHLSSNASVVPGEGTAAIDVWGSPVRIWLCSCVTPTRLEKDLRRPVVIDAGQFTTTSQWILFLPDRNVCRHDRLVRRVSQMTREFMEIIKIPEITKMSSQDMIVLGGLAAVFCWAYIILPLVFYHS